MASASDDTGFGNPEYGGGSGSNPVTIMSSIPASVPVNHGEKPEKFNGTDFKRWQQKMLFYLNILNLARFLHETTPTLEEDELDVQMVAAVDAWKHADFLCRNYILNRLDNTLYNVYSPIKTMKELWESLDKKYKTEDARMKKFIVGEFLDYKMLDSHTVISQVQELQVVIHAEGMSLSKSFQVAAIIKKLPPNWRKFKNYLKHKRKEMKLEELIVRLRIEEDNRNSEKKIGKSPMELKANVVEQGPKNKKRKHSGSGTSQGSNKKFKGKCYKCDKIGHRTNECRSKPKDYGSSSKKGCHAHVTKTDVENLCACISSMNLSAVVSKANFVGNSKEWWVDTGATRNICSDKKMFSSYQEVNDGEQLYMGNSSTSKVKIVQHPSSGRSISHETVTLGHQLLRQVFDSWILGHKSQNLSIYEETSFPFSGWNNESTGGSNRGSSYGWSIPAFSELMATPRRESYKIISTNELVVVAILICGHVYHAECLESMTPEINKYDPACPVCTFGGSRYKGKGLKLISSSSMKSSLGKPFLSGLTSVDNVYSLAQVAEFGIDCGNDNSQYSMYLHSRLLSKPSTSNPLDNRERPMANTSQVLDLEGIIHHEMHGIAEQIRIMNEINARLVQLLVTNNPPLATALVPKEADRSRRPSDHDSHSRQSAESRSSSRTQDPIDQETRRRRRSPRRDDRAHGCRDKSTTQKIKDLDARINAINTGMNALVIVDALIRQTKPSFTERVMIV
ncbi:RING/U-box superfamily protein [Actinidia rufa]|uniref:RING/U-box superfamily protein n=1 Tax=Actinidia rufa TaxID=165716 RepID=A0A7J0GUC6_9ERIC|nr:RING/U-box superfamily protein [Actinidia rufa]